jgi:hypothetical protein
MYYSYSSIVPFDSLLGKTITSISKVGQYDNELRLETSDGCKYVMAHNQDCCESVSIEEIVGDLDDLVGEPLLEASEETNQDEIPDKDYVDSFTWTFYKMGTRKGYVTIRWLGESNGYYSESVDLYHVNKDDNK